MARRALAVAGVVLAAAGCGGGEGPGAPGSRSVQRVAPALFGIAGPHPARLYALDRRTLRPRRGRGAPLAGHAFGWSFSPDRGRLAIGSDGSAELRLLDLRRLRVLGDVELTPRRGLVYITAWAGRSRVLAAMVSPGCCGLGDTTVVGVDTERRRVLWRRSLRGSLQGAARERRSLVLVVGPRYAIGPSRLVRVGGGGAVRSVPLRRIRSGWARSGSGDRFVARQWNPGLALDGRGRAFVVQAGAPVAEVDLRTLAVRYHELSEPISLLGRLRDWLDPAAEAKGIEGPERRVLWLGGRLAVTGVDNRVETGARSVEHVWATPVGLKLIDTRRWTVRTVDRSTSSIALAGRTLLAGGMTWDSRTGKLSGDGLRAYDTRGNRLYHLYRGQPVEAREPVPRGFLVGGGAGSSLFRRGALIDPASGRVLRRLRLDVTIVARDAPAWF